MDEQEAASPVQKKNKGGRPRKVVIEPELDQETIDFMEIAQPSSRIPLMARFAEALKLMIHLGPITSGPGIYFLISSVGEVVYVGQSKNVAYRMRGHATKTFQDIRMISVREERQRDRLEKLFIALFTPEYNVIFNGAATKIGDSPPPNIRQPA